MLAAFIEFAYSFSARYQSVNMAIDRLGYALSVNEYLQKMVYINEITNSSYLPPGNVANSSRNLSRIVTYGGKLHFLGVI